MRYDAILFDLDGTLLDTISLYEEAMRETFGFYGSEMSHEDFLDLYHGNRHLDDVIAERELQERAEVIRATRDAHYMDLLRSKVEWFPDAKECVDALRDIPIAIITGSWRSYVDAINERIDTSVVSETVITADDMQPHKKPDPYGLLLACTELGVDPTKCIYVGDQSFDVDAAHNAGMESLLIRRDYTAPEDMQPTVELENLTDWSI